MKQTRGRLWFLYTRVTPVLAGFDAMRACQPLIGREFSRVL